MGRIAASLHSVDATVAAAVVVQHTEVDERAVLAEPEEMVW